MGTPVIGCRCPVCISADPRNRRKRTSALIQVDGLNLLIDAGPDFRSQALAVGLDHLDAVLLTHSHYDHIAGLDDLRPLIEKGSAMPIYGDDRTLSDVRERFSYAFGISSEGSTRPEMQLIPVDVPFCIGVTRIIPIPIQHGTWTITGYRIGSLGYVTDASVISATSMEQLCGLDVLVLNALRYKPYPTHFSLTEALAVIADLRPRRAFLVHMNHHIDHAIVTAHLPHGVALAYDGLRVDIS